MMLLRLVCFLMIGFAVGCSSKSDVPAWVVKGSGAFEDHGQSVFYGVGMVNGVRNASLRRETADNRARNEIGKIFQVYTSSLMKDYAASTTAGDKDRAAEEQHVERAIKTVTSITLNGVMIVDRWQHPETSEYYSLAKLDLKRFTGQLDQLKNLDGRVRDFVRANADRLHEELREEEELMR